MLYEDFLIVCLINICEVALREYCLHLLVVENQKSSEEVVLILSNSKITIFCCLAVGFYKEYEFEKRKMIVAGLLYMMYIKRSGRKKYTAFLVFSLSFA
jgi:hypothetical protein